MLGWGFLKVTNSETDATSGFGKCRGTACAQEYMILMNFFDEGFGFFWKSAKNNVQNFLTFVGFGAFLRSISFVRSIVLPTCRFFWFDKAWAQGRI